MDESAEVARLLDILGNRNRRRIIELLRQKPCFVTEISDTLVLSPKAVIDHLQMMEREEILSCEMDDRRRKYYYLAHDILVDVSLKELRMDLPLTGEDTRKNDQLKKTVAMLARMIRAHDQILANLEQVNHDIETKINDLARIHNDLFKSDGELSVVIALSHQPLTAAELEQVTELPKTSLVEILKQFERRGIIKREKERYTLRGVHAE
ncbi:MAG: ArsR family transcriptional regulator [Methanoregula sp.]|jgi:ArsR family transcriptional regulator|uniref:ArsR family transcriptional regulator n=1 Tax=Methanoregula sp. TaxID=2052170 RepID=UPI0025E47E65|nr:ArsR family transcriptional regulator [Methanoregula sp.]MCK9630178.1 ArsR family transcriptional regulator [Methanoregula sp.]